MAESEESLEKQAEGLASEFVSSLGLTDIILGSLFLYGRYAYAPLTSRELPTTGHAIVDVALLTCAAALVGKTLTLMVAFLMGGIEALLERLFKTELTAALARAQPTLGSPEIVKRPLQSAAALARAESAVVSKHLQRIENQAILSYGASFLAIAFAIQAQGVAAVLIASWVLWLVALGLIVLGFLQQADYFAQAIEFLKTIDSRPQVRECARDCREGDMADTIAFTVDTNETVNTNDAARFLLALNALHVAAMLTDPNQHGSLEASLNDVQLPSLEHVDSEIYDHDLFAALAAINSVLPEQAAGSLELTKLRTGSLSGIVREIFGHVFGRLSKLAAALPNLRPHGTSAAFESVVRNMENDAPNATLFRKTAFIAGANARVALAKMGATALTVPSKS